MNETSHAPDFPYDFEWVNTVQPLSLFDDLCGYVVLVHFWTSSNVESHHALATLAELEQRFADRAFRVVGVHSGKFSAERDIEHVTRAVRRFGVRHPVVMDEGGEIWKSYQSRAWPFLALVDATGHLRFQGAGEPDLERMADGIRLLLDDAAAEGDEPYSTVPYDTGDYDDGDGPETLDGLRFPTGLAFDAARGWLWIADSARHRIVAIDPVDGGVQLAIGNGDPGAADGEFAAARFHLPKGLCVDGDAVYVADAGNHLLRRVDLGDRRVDTVLGTGRPVLDATGGGSGRAQPIHSPWDLCLHGDHLFVAMTGMHQIWRVERETMTAVPFAGNDTKGLFDGPVYDASLAQPASLASCGDELVFVDSDSSSLRAVNLADGKVTTKIEGGVFRWGDADGAAPKLQYPCGVAAHGTDLFVADTFNDKVRLYRSGELTTLPLDLCRPEGLAIHADTLFVADTGNHRIVKVDLAASSGAGTVHEVVPVRGLPRARTTFGSGYLECAPVRLPPLTEGTLRFPMELPQGAALLSDTRAVLEASNIEGHPFLVDVDVHADVDEGRFVARGIATGEEGEGVVRLRLVYATCHAPGQVCHVHERRLDLPVTIAPDVGETADVVVE